MLQRFRFFGALAVLLAVACGASSSSNDDRRSSTDPTNDESDDQKDDTRDGGEGETQLDGAPRDPADGGSADASADAAPIPFPDFSEAVGTGTKPGLVTGRIYDELGMNVDARMDDLKTLGVRVIRIEIELATPMATYSKILDAAHKRGIEVLGLVTQATMPGSPNPLAGTRTEFDTVFVPKVIAAIDATTTALPRLRYVEVWNEPDVYAFSPLFTYSPQAGCGTTEGAFRYALLATRVFETMNERRIAGKKTPKLAAFSFSRHDDECVRKAVIDAQPIQSHRAGYRPGKGLADGLPADILAIHGYGNGGKLPNQAGYTYSGGSFGDGVNEFLGAKFADGKSMVGNLPVWYTEIGVCRKQGFSEQQQAAAVAHVMSTLRSHPRITASFVYVYRDDEVPGGGEQCGLRANAAGGFAAHAAYATYQTQAAIK